MIKQYIAETTMKLIVRTRDGGTDVRVVEPGSRTGIPDDIEILAEIPVSKEYGYDEIGDL